ncbi:MAG: hypothetical protein ACI4KF_02200 [Huintestinicola sp.]
MRDIIDSGGYICPVCGEEVCISDTVDGVCTDCYADEIQSGVSDSTLYEFLRDNFELFKEYIRDYFANG